jgi:collagenase-like PrtC family protease
MKLCVGLRGDPEHAKEVLSQVGDKIYEVFIAAPPNVSQTGRVIPFLATRKSIAQVRKITKYHGVKLNVLLNAVCYGGKEFTPKFSQKMIDFLKFLEEIKVDSVTLGNSHLIELFLQHRNNLKVCVSTFVHVDNPLKARAFEKMGVDRIIIRQSLSHDFRLLKRFRNYVNLDFEIFANNRCIYAGQCPHHPAHANYHAHDKDLSPEQYKKWVDPYAAFCNKERRNNLLQQIMAPLVRPEDIHLYEEMGFELFKLALRQDSAERIIKIVNIYNSRRWDGSVGELWMDSKKHGFPSEEESIPNRVLDGLLEKVAYLNTEDRVPYYKEIYNKLVTEDKKLKIDNKL